MKTILVLFLLGIIFTIIIGYIDFHVISPILLPEDYCYYHTHDIPLWVDVFYMNGASNGHPEGSITHLLLIVALGFILGYFTTKYLRQKQILTSKKVKKIPAYSGILLLQTFAFFQLFSSLVGF